MGAAISIPLGPSSRTHHGPLLACSQFLDKGDPNALGSVLKTPAPPTPFPKASPRSLWDDSLQSRCLQNPCQRDLYF